MTQYTLADLAAVHEELADAITTYQHEVPAVLTDGALLHRCGPIAFGFAVFLRANNLPGGLIHVTGQPAGFPPGTGHYLATSGRWVIDWAYRQFDPTAPAPVLYERADLDPLITPFGTGAPGRPWHPWTGISGELEHDDPLYPDFVDYTANTNPFDYLAPGTDDPEWTTPYDDR